MRTLEEIHTANPSWPVDRDGDRSIASRWARPLPGPIEAKKAKWDACPNHERIETATREQSNRGDHRGHCKHCGMDMSYDSGD